MARMKVVITDYIEPDLEWESDQFKGLGVDFSYHQLKQAPPERLLEVVADADVLIVNMAVINAEVIQGLRRAKLIIRHGVGYDNVDVEAASRRGIVVAYMPDYCMHEVAEQAVALIFACQRKLSTQMRLTEESSREGHWVFEAIYPVHSLRGKVLGVIGCGRIGSVVFHMMQSFGLGGTLVCDPYLSDERRKELGCPVVSLDELLSQADIVTVHVPLGPETYHLLDETQFELMKPTAILVNTARGGVVNLAALDRALRDGRPMFAGIDVYEQEPPGSDLAILRNPKAICTPHLAWLSEEAGWSIREKIVEDVRRFLQHESPRYQINKGVQNRFL